MFAGPVESRGGRPAGDPPSGLLHISACRPAFFLPALFSRGRVTPAQIREQGSIAHHSRYPVSPSWAFLFPPSAGGLTRVAFGENKMKSGLFVQIKLNIKNHPKFIAVKREMGLRDRDLKGILAELWSIAMISEDMGNLGHLGLDDLDYLLDWEEDNGSIAASLTRHGFVDMHEDGSLTAHGLAELLKKKDTNERVAKSRAKTRTDAVGRMPDAIEIITTGNVTQQDVTQCNKESQKVALEVNVEVEVDEKVNIEKEVELLEVEVETKPPPAESFSAECDQILKHYLHHFPKRTKQALKLKGKVIARLREGYSVDDLMAAIDGCLASSFHIDNNHTGLGLIFRSSEKVDQFMGYAKKPPRGNRERSWVDSHREIVAGWSGGNSQAQLEAAQYPDSYVEYEEIDDAD